MMSYSNFEPRPTIMRWPADRIGIGDALAMFVTAAVQARAIQEGLG